MFKRMKNGTSQEKGQVIVVVALMMMALLGLTAMAIDLSFVFVQRRDMQNAADAGALAGGRMVALFSADPTLHYRYRDIYYEVLNSAQANGANDITAYMVHCGDRALSRELRPNDYAALERCPCACGVWVKSETRFDTFLSRIFGITELGASAEAQSEFGLPQNVAGLAPIALHKSVLQKGTWGMVGSTYTMWDSKKEGGATRGWLGLDCIYPAKGSQCSPDANSLKKWMDPPYYTGVVNVGDNVGGDPGTKTAVLHHAEVGEILIIPVYDYLYHFTNSKYCNPSDSKYDMDKCRAGEAFEGTTPVYTPDSGYNGKYYYHVISFAAFEVNQVGDQGGDKFLTGKFISYVTPSDWKCPTCPGHCEYANGAKDSLGLVVVKLTK